MASISESFEHRKIHETKEKLAQEARMLNNHGISKSNIHSDIKSLSPLSFQEAYRLDALEPSQKVGLHVTGTLIRLLTNSPTRGERRRIREMAGISDVSDIKNHKGKTAAKARETIKGCQVVNKYGITPEDLRLYAPGWDAHDEENFQDGLARANEEDQY